VVENKCITESKQKLSEDTWRPTRLAIDMENIKLYDDENVTENISINAFNEIVSNDR
jgi:signal recognition particle receptor subunit beta